MSVFSSQIVQPPPPPICIQMHMLLPYFSHFPAIPLWKLGPSWEKTYIFKIFVERAINSVDFEELQFSTIFTHFGDQAYNRIIVTNNRTMRVQELQLLFHNDYMIDYKSTKFYCSSVFAFRVSRGRVKNTTVLLRVKMLGP